MSGRAWGALACLGIGTRQRVQSLSEPRPDPWWVRYANVCIIVVAVLWACAVYVWRVCYPMLVQRPKALGSRAMGVGLLVGFVIIWIMCMLS